ncbi:MerR family transcriptional regulator [Desulforhopalus singaporensis]|uniref:MerR family transcriptional regulator, heat shock protein HspR n=1 Tax=Desulforhopalus singaporensis TaxID=91360 RepID=A0A1H0N4I9_9BACT|nr:MerR family transcriptional regulator [Desulforhopalus singaporensis]SDO87634.1 MerR family transcriptional regulator, heat shock protein HspR [Desulforhopalus singaporensis]
MARRKPPVEPLKKDLPIYPIGVAAKLLEVHPRTLRIYEEEGLIRPERVGNRRLYSANDITWIGCLRRMIHEDGISIPGIKKLLRYATCYEIAECPESVHCKCDAVVDRAVPRSLRIAGDPEQEKKAKERDLSVRAARTSKDVDAGRDKKKKAR